MAINPIGISNPMQSTDPNDFRTRMQQALGPVAQLFGESVDQLQSDLSSGNTSLSDLASQKGISQTDLVNAIKQGLQSSGGTGQSQTSSLSDSQLTNIANRIANHKHHHHHGGGGAGAAAAATQTDPFTDPSSSTGASGTGTSDPTLSATESLLQMLESQNPGSVDQSM